MATVRGPTQQRTPLEWVGEKSPTAKPLKGFGGAGVLEVIEDLAGDTFRAVYTVKFKGVVYVLHAFQKKSKKGSETPKSDVDLVKARLKLVEAHHAQRQKEESDAKK